MTIVCWYEQHNLIGLTSGSAPASHLMSELAGPYLLSVGENEFISLINFYTSSLLIYVQLRQ
jgi:hypothetical protein